MRRNPLGATCDLILDIQITCFLPRSSQGQAGQTLQEYVICPNTMLPFVGPDWVIILSLSPIKDKLFGPIVSTCLYDHQQFVYTIVIRIESRVYSIDCSGYKHIRAIHRGTYEWYGSPTSCASYRLQYSTMKHLWPILINFCEMTHMKCAYQCDLHWLLCILECHISR